MATHTAETVGSSLLQPTYLAADSGGDRFEPGALLHVRNADAASTDMTIQTPKTFDTDLAVDDRVNTVAAGGEGFVRVPRSAIYIADDGLVDVTWTNTTATDFAVLA